MKNHDYYIWNDDENVAVFERENANTIEPSLAQFHSLNCLLDRKRAS